MRRVWDTIAVIIIAVIVFSILLHMIERYIPLALLAAAAFCGGRFLYGRSRNW